MNTPSTSCFSCYAFLVGLLNCAIFARDTISTLIIEDTPTTLLLPPFTVYGSRRAATEYIGLYNSASDDLNRVTQMAY